MDALGEGAWGYSVFPLVWGRMDIDVRIGVNTRTLRETIIDRQSEHNRIEVMKFYSIDRK